MSSYNHSQINRLETEIARLNRDIATESKKEADLTSKINRATEAINRTTNASMMNSKLRDIERYNKDLATVKRKQADISDKRARKSKDLRTYLERQARDDERSRKKIADEQRKLIREREAHERRLSSGLRRQVLSESVLTDRDKSAKKYDFFISHASEDKEGFVEPLAKLLQAKRAVVWYDDFVLEIGDSLRREIDRGLANSRFGIVVLSENFFRKEWPQRELDGLVTLETQNAQSQKIILPIWHKISKDEVAQNSPILADKIAFKTSILSIEEIADELLKFV